jgi:hypothetical protein
MHSFVVATLLSTVTVAGFLLGSDRTMHWFVIPVWCCGVLIGCDTVDWVRGRLDLFDPAGIIGLLGFHFFFLAPLLQVAWDVWMPYVEPPPDWRDWLGFMAVVNVAGLFLYQIARRWAASRNSATPQSFWRIEWTRLAPAAACALAISAVLQCWVYAAHGGLSGYVGVVTEGIGRPETESAFSGMGWLFLVSESFPIVAMIAFAVYAVRKQRATGWSTLILVLLGYFLLAMLFGGLRGSRSQTIWALFWATGIIHLWIRPLNKKLIAAGLCFLLAFMYLYGFYKSSGSDVVALREDLAWSEDERSRTLQGLLVGDLARSDVHALLLYRLWMSLGDYEYAAGRTYLGSIALLVPRRVWPERLPTKVFYGTEALYGAGSYDEEELVASWVYGLAGETKLNFGVLAVPLAYVIFGLLVGRLQRFMSRLHMSDGRWLLCPFLVNLTVAVLHSDTDNLLFMLFKDGLVPLSLVWFACLRVSGVEAIGRDVALLATPNGWRR